MPVKLYYHQASPPSRAVWMLLEELKASGKFDYDEHEVDLYTQEHKSASFMKINPAGAVPAICDDGFNLWESRAVLEYIAGKYGASSGKGNLLPSDPKTRAKMAMILFTDADNYGKMLEYLNVGGVMQKGEGLNESKKEDFEKVLKSYNDLIGSKNYMVGDHLTIADFSCLASLGVLSLIDFKEFDKYPNIGRWYEVLKKLPSVDKCFVKAENSFKVMFQAKLAENTKQ